MARLVSSTEYYRGKEGDFLMIKETVTQDNPECLYRASKYRRQKLTELKK